MYGAKKIVRNRPFQRTSFEWRRSAVASATPNVSGPPTSTK